MRARRRHGAPVCLVMASQTQDLFQLPPGITGDALVRQLNRHLRTIAVQLARLGTTSTDAGGARLQNVGRARADTDAVTRRDLLDYSVFAPEGEIAVAHRGIVARGGLRIPKYARDQDEAVTLGQVHNVTEDMIATGIATGGGGGGVVGTPVPQTFTGPASSVTLSFAPSVVIPYKNGVQQHNDGVGTTEGNYKLAGTTLTILLNAGDVLDTFAWP